MPPEYLAARPDGGLILATDALYEMTARHAATALTHITAATADDHRVAVGFNTNRAVRATLTVRRHGHTVARTTRNVRAGHHGLTVHGRFPARPHDVQVTVQAANGTASHDTVSLYLGGKLTIKEARAFITPTLEEGSITSCQRVTRRSVTCTIEAAGERSTATATLTPDGLIRVGAIHAAVAAPLDRARHGRRRVIHKRLAPWRQTPRGAARFWPSPSSRPGWWRRRADRRPFITLVVLQVALTVADGGTNREAAAALFLSPKTIEFHVSSKLGLSARPATGAMHADCAP